MNTFFCMPYGFMSPQHFPGLPWPEGLSVHRWAVLSLWSFLSSTISPGRQCPQPCAVFVQHPELLKTGINKWSTWKDHAPSFMSRVNLFIFSFWPSISLGWTLSKSPGSFLSQLDQLPGSLGGTGRDSVCQAWSCQMMCTKSLCCYWCLRLSGTNYKS